jgi:hypothetical protein
MSHNTKFILYSTTLLILLCLTSSTPHVASVEVRAYVLVTKDFPCDTVFNFVPKEARLILITRDVHNHLSQQQREAFDKIIVIDKFDSDNILKAVKNNVTDYSHTRLITNDETVDPLIAGVREILKIPGSKVQAITPFL